MMGPVPKAWTALSAAVSPEIKVPPVYVLLALLIVIVPPLLPNPVPPMGASIMSWALEPPVIWPETVPAVFWELIEALLASVMAPE